MFLYEFHVSKLNSMYYSNWFVMSYILFSACFTKCSAKCTHQIRVTLKINLSTLSQKIWYSHKIGIGQCKCNLRCTAQTIPCSVDLLLWFWHSTSLLAQMGTWRWVRKACWGCIVLMTSTQPAPQCRTHQRLGCYNTEGLVRSKHFYFQTQESVMLRMEGYLLDRWACAENSLADLVKKVEPWFNMGTVCSALNGKLLF